MEVGYYGKSGCKIVDFDQEIEWKKKSYNIMIE